MIRRLSHSEVSRALDCEAQWDFAYGGQLAGSALKPKVEPTRLREGKAWGAGVAAWQVEVLRTDALTVAHSAIDAELEKQVERQRELGVYVREDHEQLGERLHRLLDHYVTTADPLPIDRLEHEVEVPIPSRGRAGGRSNRYRLVAYFDGVHRDDDGHEWLVEFKLRGQLEDLRLMSLQRQPRWYAWAAREALGIDPIGVIVDERWNELPKPVRMVKGRKKDDPPRPSHAIDQLTTPALYVAACEEHGEEPQLGTLDALRARRWHQRQPIIFRPGELDEAGWQLRSAARLIRELDSGERYPIRNPSRARCPGCQFREICPTPDDVDLVDALFERKPPKRDPISRR